MGIRISLRNVKLALIIQADLTISHAVKVFPHTHIQKPTRRRRHLQLPPFNPQQDFKASELEIRRDLQHICDCTSTEAGQLLLKDKTRPAVPERRRKPRETKEVKAVLGLASYIWEGERGLLPPPVVDTSVPPTRKRRTRTPGKQPQKRMKLASPPMLSKQVQTTDDFSLFREIENPLITQRLNQITSYLNLPMISVTQTLRNHALDENATRRYRDQRDSRLSRAATHVTIARRIQEMKAAVPLDRQ